MIRDCVHEACSLRLPRLHTLLGPAFGLTSPPLYRNPVGICYNGKPLADISATRTYLTSRRFLTSRKRRLGRRGVLGITEHPLELPVFI